MERYRNLTVLAASLVTFALVGSRAASAKSPVETALATVALATGPTDKWYGPTSGPAPAKDQNVVCIEYLAQDITAATWCKGVAERAAKLGWKSTTIDGQGTADGQRKALQEAIALKRNGIVLASVDAQSSIGLLKEASDGGIKIIGIHSVAGPGPAPKVYLFTNI